MSGLDNLVQNIRREKIRSKAWMMQDEVRLAQGCIAAHRNGDKRALEYAEEHMERVAQMLDELAVVERKSEVVSV